MPRQGIRRHRSTVYILLGVALLLAPVVLTQVKNTEQHRLAERYAHSVAQLDQSQRQAILASAHRYNDQMSQASVRDPWVHGVDENSAAYRQYLSELDVDGMMARVRVPAVGIDLPVYHGTSTKTLAAGVGHLYGTSLPVGGKGTHAVLTGHTGLATLTMFDNLTHMKDGDVFFIDVMGQTLAYRVNSILTVLPDQVESLKRSADHDQVTLVTCTPYGINSHRLLVTGERIALPSGTVEQHYRSPWQPWMLAVIVVSILALAYLVRLLVRRGRANRSARHEPPSRSNQ